MCVVSLKELFVSRGVSEPWENEELITCCVCFLVGQESLLVLVVALLYLSPGH